jgi:hypothetical protein
MGVGVGVSAGVGVEVGAGVGGTVEVGARVNVEPDEDGGGGVDVGDDVQVGASVDVGDKAEVAHVDRTSTTASISPDIVNRKYIRTLYIYHSSRIGDGSISLSGRPSRKPICKQYTSA